jgi:hypothetical protein
MIGSDTWGLEPYDFAKGVPESFAYCHINLFVRRGIYNFENLDLDQLSADGAYEFLFSWAPIKLVGRHRRAGQPDRGLLSERAACYRGAGTAPAPHFFAR